MRLLATAFVSALGLALPVAGAQPATTRSADGAQQAAPGPDASDKVYAAYRQSIDRDIATYRDSVGDFRARRTDALWKAEVAQQRAAETANAVYKAGTARAYELLEAGRKSRNAGAIQAYDREIKASTTAGDFEKAAEIGKAKERFIIAVLEEGAKLQAESIAVAAIISSPKQEVVAKPRETVKLHIRATIDGSDELIIARDSARWANKSWGISTVVVINGIEWNTNASRVLLNSGPTRFLPPVDFSKAVVTGRSGREIVACEPSADNLRVVFADANNGSDIYEITIELPLLD